MRKDAKIGFAVGGVLLAVLTVYAIVVPGKHKSVSDKTVSLATGGTPSGTTPVSVSNTTAAPTPTLAPTPAPVAGNENPTPPSNTSPTATPGNPTPVDPKPQSVASNSKDGFNWDKLLNSAASKTETPDGKGAPAGSDQDQNGAAKPTGTATGHSVNTGVSDDIGKKDTVINADPAPTNTGVITDAKPVARNIIKPSSGDQFYVIKSGQTLTQVAAEEYGNSRFYVAILRANPTINPSKLKPGTKIILPDISEVKPEATQASARQTMKPSAGTYTVASGDTLYRISKKLYGTSRRADDIYEMNKETIGSNKAHLRLGLVLNLPRAGASTETASSM